MDVLITPPRTIGMDVGDKYINLHVIESDGEVSEETRIATTKKAVQNYFCRCPKSRVALEVGTHSRWMSEIIGEFGHEVLVANARKLRAIYENDKKDDRRDAQLLAEIARVQPSLLRSIKHRGEEAQAALAVVKARDCLVAARTKLLNHVRGVVKSMGHRLSKCSAESFPARLEEVPETRRAILEPVMAVIAELTVKIRAYDRQIDELCKTGFPETLLLRQVSGVGPVTSLGFVTTLDDPNRFPRSRAVGSFLGLRPRLDKSGESDRQLRITKAGSKLMRRLLVGAAEYILGPHGPDTDLRRWGLKLAASGGKRGKGRAAAAVARKLAILLLKLWKTGEVYDPLYQTNKCLSGQMSAGEQPAAVSQSKCDQRETTIAHMP